MKNIIVLSLIPRESSAARITFNMKQRCSGKKTGKTNPTEVSREKTQKTQSHPTNPNRAIQRKSKPTPTEVSSSASESPKEPLADSLKLVLPQNWKKNNDVINLSRPFKYSNIRIGKDDLPSGIEKVYEVTKKTSAPNKTTSNTDFVKLLSSPEDDAGVETQRRGETF